jgi:hypothetical protein
LSLRYQWQRSDDGGTTWADIYGARSRTLTVSQLTYAADNNDRYRVVASSLAAQSVTSNAAKLTIESQGWQQLGATIKGGVSRNNLGISVSVGGSGASTTVAVGESGEIGDLLFSPVRSGVAGSATVYAWNGSSWATKGGPIVGGTFTILGDSYGTKTGSRVAISRDGNFLAVLSREQSGGNVKVYAWSGSAWTQRGSAFEMYVSEIAISDDGASVVTGGPHWGTADRGLVRNYVWNGTSWTQRGGDIFGLSSGSYLGTSVSISADGNTIAAGAPIFGSGRASVYSWTGSTWQEKSYYTGGSNNDRFGQSVSLSADGSKIAVSAPLKSGGAKAGVYSVGSGGSLFSIVGQEVSGGYGLSNVQLSDDGSALSVVGSYTNVLETGNIGWARVYRWSGTAWVASGDDFSGLSSDGSSDGSLASAYVCALSGDGNVLVFGAPLGDGNATDSGLVRIYGYAG